MTVAERDGQIARLNQAVVDIETSTIWRVARLWRWLVHQLKRVKRIVAFLPAVFRRGGGLRGAAAKTIQLYQREGFSGLKRGLRIMWAALDSDGFDRNDYTKWISRYDTLTDEIRVKMHAHIEMMRTKPLISVVMPVYNTKTEWLIQAIESVRKQIYSNWELCIADDASTDEAIRPILEQYAKKDSRIKVIFCQKNGHISAASNSALKLAAGEWVAFLDHDDLLAEHALLWVADTINRHPQARLIYSDEDKVNEEGKRSDPYFKSDWNKDLFYSHNLISHLGVYQTALLRDLSGFRLGFEGSQDYDLALRCIEHIKPEQIYHIPWVLYHWRAHAKSTAQAANVKPYAYQAAKKALDEHFRRRGVKATAELLDFGTYRIRYTLPDTLPLVSLIIPTRNRMQLLKKCIDGILKKTTYPNYEILIVDNGSDESATLQGLEKLQSDSRISVVRDNRPFNYSALNNAAVKLARGEVVGLLNNDLEVISPEWLTEMVSHALRPEVGAVGARLWYPNQTLQHAGIVLGLRGMAGHAHKYLSRYQYGYLGRARLIQNFSAVTAACLVIRKSVYEEVGGLNEADLQVAFNDIDFCLRVREAGYCNIWTPYAELYHHESVSRGFEDTPEKQIRLAKEVEYMKQHWGQQLLNDPAYSLNLTLVHDDFSFAWPPRVNSVLGELFMSDLIFHETEYLVANPDVAAAVKGGAFRSGLEHYKMYGEREGRMLRQLFGKTSREEKVFHLLDKKGLGLEIGPSHSPVASKKKGFNVQILDLASATELRNKYQGQGVNLDNIEEVDFVWHGESFQELIGRTNCYDWIIASHVIEHVPDVISYLQQCEALLKPDGVLSLVIPDKRYCFDYFSSSSTTGDLLDAYIEKRLKPTHGQIFDHAANASKRNGNIAWASDRQGGADELLHTFHQAEALWTRSVSTTDYIDVHCWRFTPSSFRLLIADLLNLGLINMEIKVEFGTTGCEFYVSLGKKGNASAMKIDRFAALQKRKLEDV